MGALHTLLLGLITLVVAAASTCDKNLIPELSFKISGSSLAFPCASTRAIYTTSGRYIPKNVIVTRLQIYKDDAYVTLPRYRPGVPFSVAKFNMKNNSYKAQLEPFPCWNIHEEGNCEAIQNAIDLFLDSIDRLWVLDLGITNTLEHPVRRCSPKIWGLNVQTGEVVKTVNLDSFVTSDSRLQYLVVDYSAAGVPFAYVSDAGTRAIIVIDISSGTGYRVVLPDAVGGTDTAASGKDVLYLQLVRKTGGNVVYFSYLSSPRLFSIQSERLETGQAAGAVIDAGGKPSGARLVFLGTDNGSAIFFRYKGESDIYIWNSDSPFKPDNFALVQHGSYCRLATQVVPGWKRLMWTIESNFHDYVTNSTGCLGATVAIYPLVKSSS